jgi:hypothetical protein
VSDPDEFVSIELTRETRTIENSDPDEFNTIASTRMTFVKEDSDPDEFLIKFDYDVDSVDFDDFLLI